MTLGACLAARRAACQSDHPEQPHRFSHPNEPRDVGTQQIVTRCAVRIGGLGAGVVEAALEQAGAHLARVLSESPGAFHDRHRLARWMVVARRAIPAITIVLMVVGALLLPRLTDPTNAGLWMALHYLPIGLLAVSFSLQELAQIEIPPWPRRSCAACWATSAVSRLDAGARSAH